MNSQGDAGDSARAKVATIFRELAGSRAEGLDFRNQPAPTDPAGTPMALLTAALTARYDTADATEIAHRLCCWNEDAAFLVALHLFPERFTQEELEAAVEGFFIFVPEAVSEAAQLAGYYDDVEPQFARPSNTSAAVEAILRDVSDVIFPAQIGRKRVEVNSRDSSGDTPLHVLMCRDDLAGAEVLLAAGAEVNAIGDMGETPLHSAVRRENVQMAAALLAAGADPDIRSEFDRTARELAAERGGEIARLFVKSEGS